MSLRACIDKINAALGVFAAWLFFATGMMITYEVIARYVFNAPTIWAAELSQLLLVWGTFLAMARALARREHIRIVILLSRLGDGTRKAAEVFVLLFIAAFSLVVVWYGWPIAMDSFVRGRSTGTMLNIPNWWSEIVIPLGFALLFVQSLVELAKLRHQRQLPDADSGF